MSFPEMLLLRKQLNMPQSDMAYYLGIKNRLLISQWETGYRAPSEAIRRLVRYLTTLSFSQAKTILLGMKKHSSK